MTTMPTYHLATYDQAGLVDSTGHMLATEIIDAIAIELPHPTQLTSLRDVFAGLTPTATVPLPGGARAVIEIEDRP